MQNLSHVGVCYRICAIMIAIENTVLLQHTRAGQRPIPVGVRSQNPQPAGPTVSDLQSAAVH